MPSVQVMPTRLRPRGRQMWAMQPRGRRLAVDAGDGDDRDAAVLSLGKQRVRGLRSADGLPALPACRCGLRPGRGVDADDAALLPFQRPADVGGDHVDAGHVQADDPRRLDRQRLDVRVDRAGDVRSRSDAVGPFRLDQRGGNELLAGDQQAPSAPLTCFSTTTRPSVVDAAAYASRTCFCVVRLPCPFCRSQPATG